MTDIATKKPRNFKSLTIRLALAFFIFGLLIILIADGMDFLFSFKNQQEIIGEHQKLIGENAANTVKEFIMQKISTLRSASRIGDLASSSDEERRLFLQKLMGAEPSFRQITLLSSHYEELASVSRNSDLFSHPLLESVDENLFPRMEIGKSYSGPVYIDEITSEPLMIIAVPVNSLLGDFEGILMAEVNLKFMWDLVGSLDVGKSGLAYVVDKQGRLIAFEDVSRVLKGENLAHLHEVSQFISAQELPAVHRVETSMGIMGTKVVSIPVPLGNPDWAVIIEMPLLEAYSPLMLQLQVSLGVILLSVLMVIAGSAFLSKRITRPIIELRDAASKISQGDLDAQVHVNSDDEIGDLAKAFTQMADAIKAYEEKISKHAKELERHEKELEGQVALRTKELEAKADDLTMSKKATLNILEDMEESNRALIEAQNGLEQSLKEIRKLDSQKDQFISIAAHELKTPLTSIKGFTDLLKKEVIANNPELRQKYLGIIFRDTKRLSELISNILELSRMDIGTLKLAFQEVAVSQFIEEVKEQMNIIITQKGLESEFVVEENLPKITIDKDRMVQVLSNIINNAVHYTEKGKIVVHAKKTENMVLFSVKDSGQGIPKEFHGKIFERFYQVDSPLTRKIGGTGLGLSLSKGFVEAMGGKIWFESDENQGATFYFTIPIEQKNQREELRIVGQGK